LGVAATVVMPVYASLAKVEATRGYGANVELHGDTFEESLAHAREIAGQTGATLIHAFDDPWIIAGQGTVGLEIASDAPHLERVLIPVGGGGLASGVATALRALRPDVRLYGVRPARIPVTIADGAAVAAFGTHTGPLVEELLDEIVEVDDEAISEAIVLLLERTKQVVEGAGALPLAALLAGVLPSGGPTLLVVSGGNIDPGRLMQVVRHGLGEAGRYLFVRVMLEDRPGQLLRVVELAAELRVNVLSVVHHRTGPGLPVGAVEVELTLETRDRDHAAEVVQALQQAGYDVRR
jgi:threonine dehydratase